MSTYDEKPPVGSTDRRPSLENGVGEIIHTVSASGHRDQLQRHYGPLQICGLALNIDSAWVAFAGSLILSLPNGGPAGVLYELITACIYYGIIAASIAEVYHHPRTEHTQNVSLHESSSRRPYLLLVVYITGLLSLQVPNGAGALGSSLGKHHLKAKRCLCVC